jgi:hypothetical protein
VLYKRSETYQDTLSTRVELNKNPIFQYDSFWKIFRLMLFRENYLQDLLAGKVSLAFRKWKRASVKKGSLLKTYIGLVEVTDVGKITLEDISEKQAVLAGYADRRALEEELSRIPEGELYRIGLRYHSPDPRISLRSKTSLGPEEFQEMRQKLQRLDTLSKNGPWTIKVLTAIRENPQLISTALARKTGFERMWLKLNVRKLKNLGLTISHEIGYSLAPLGEFVLRKLEEET